MIEIKVDAADYLRLGNMIAAAGSKAPDALRRAVNHTGDRAKTQMTRSLTAQTGLKRQVIVRALKVNKAFSGGQKGGGSGSYVIAVTGGNVSLKFFSARETRRGVSAAPWNSRRVFPSVFLKGGRFPGRKALSLGGHAYKRAAGGRLPIAREKSGLFIPEEMVAGATRNAFFDTVRARLPDRLAHELARLFGG